MFFIRKLRCQNPYKQCKPCFALYSQVEATLDSVVQKKGTNIGIMFKKKEKLAIDHIYMTIFLSTPWRIESKSATANDSQQNKNVKVMHG